MTSLYQMAMSRGQLTPRLSDLSLGRRASAANPEEVEFQKGIRATPWFSEFVKQYGEEPNLDDPDYNYRAAWKQGIRPEIYEHDGTYHWPSGYQGADGNDVMLKSENHPTMWMQKFMETTGRDPNELGIKTPEAANAFLMNRGRR